MSLSTTTTTTTTTTNDMMSNKRSLEYQSSEDYEQSKSKKQKNYTPTPSKVVHLRNLPIDCTEHEIMALASPFGQVEHILILKGKSQGFIQMADLTSATAFIQFYTTIQGSIRSKNFFVQYSNREEITSYSSVETPNNILLVTISNIIYPVTIDVLYQLFSKYGSVLKILIFSKSGNFQSLIQLHTTDSAINAKRELDGQNIYNGCCTLKIQYSSLNNLRIKYNNDKSRDFTNPTLLPGTTSLLSNPIGFGISPAPTAVIQHQHQHQHQQALAIPQMVPHVGAFIPQVTGNTVLIVGGLPTKDVTPDDLFTLFGVYGDPLRVKIMFNKKDTALIQMNLPQQADLAIQYLNNVPFRGHTIRVNPSKHNSISLPKSGDTHGELTKDYTGSTTHRFKLPGSKNYQNIHPPSPTLHLSNLPQDPNIEELYHLQRPPQSNPISNSPHLQLQQQHNNLNQEGKTDGEPFVSIYVK
ncbi:RNA-binding region RNP-1 domain-containing protein [Heterostelium album PN500]|uniref:RNA-binding region RNP-1 domain-containing protein n=1 Tax=Heterostelium pallidum (strain ATCC 26659 / Pp 5 / PN500) TaxID=670386 RepID=D3B4Z4_HETP5|nr:RNA-binding region RNP-1 domain-containing protein [Heterostelium album PN500]EFA84392.1 RNA-binding region RNP-1 domain-containing protein [Heterostelium album PN500]|eukprot:XP_020436506.1 RNA-binding region RNP-1 domain-containing protein [Heterostelium album PN500]